MSHARRTCTSRLSCTSCKARDTFTPTRYTVETPFAMQALFAVVVLSCWSFFSPAAGAAAAPLAPPTLCTDSRSRQVLFLFGIIRPARRAGSPSPSRPAGRTRPRGPEPLYTVRRDLVGHGALDVTGGRSPLGLAGPLRAVRGTCRPGREPAATRCGRVSPWDPAARVGTRGGSPPGSGPAGTCLPLVPREDVRGSSRRAGARTGRGRPTAP